MPSLEEAHRRHAGYYLSLAEQATPHLTSNEQATWLDKLEKEYANLRSALRWCKTGEAEAGLRLAVALLVFWELRGYVNEGRRFLDEALRSEEVSVRTKLRAQALNGAGILAQYQGDYEQARARFEESMVILRDLGDKQVAAPLNGLGVIALRQGDYETAKTLFEESLAVYKALRNKQGVAALHNNLGNIAEAQGDYKTAKAQYQEALNVNQETGNRAWQANNLNNLGTVAFKQDDCTTALTLYEEGLVIRRELGDKLGIASSLYNLGKVAYRQGNLKSAQARHKESLIISREVGDEHSIAESLEAMAELAVEQGQLERATRLWAAANILREAIGSLLPPHEKEEVDRKAASARATLGEKAFATTWEQGQAMTIEQAIEYALEDGSKEYKRPLVE